MNRDGVPRVVAAVARSIALSLLVAVSISVVQATEIAGVVVGVTDGDTVKVLDKRKVLHKIRLAGIDAPEKRMRYGQRAKQRLSDMVYRRSVIVVARNKDRYGRTIGKIVVDGRDANLAMIEAGLAWHYKRYSKQQSPGDRIRYAQAETNARRQGVGLWAQPQPTPPWEWRAKRR